MSLPPGVRLADVVALGCGSQEMRNADRYCHVVDWARRQGGKFGQGQTKSAR